MSAWPGCCWKVWIWRVNDPMITMIQQDLRSLKQIKYIHYYRYIPRPDLTQELK